MPGPRRIQGGRPVKADDGNRAVALYRQVFILAHSQFSHSADTAGFLEAGNFLGLETHGTEHGIGVLAQLVGAVLDT